jgi:hypothetical protein
MKGLHPMNRFKPTVFFLAVLMATIGLCGVGNVTNEAPDVQARPAKFREMFDRLQPVDIHGKVIDQDASAVAEVQVKIEWDSANYLTGNTDPGQVTWVTSDASGLWEFRIEKPNRAFVVDACKPGYEYVYTKESNRDLIESKTTKNDPAMVHLRKKGETTFLIRREGYQLIRVFSPHSQTNSLDVLADDDDVSATGGYVDFHVVAEYSEPSGAWTVTYSATNGTDGIAIGNDLLYEAPQDGYRKEVIVNGPSWPRYLYLRSRTPAIYSRLDLEHFIWKESDTNQGFRISYKAWVNPYGARNLEYESDLAGQWQLRNQLEREAKDNLLQNKHPSKPDLPKLIKAAKERAVPDKGNP